MTADEWDVTTNSTALFAAIEGAFKQNKGVATRRKRVLFAVACCRQIWVDFKFDDSRSAVEAAEQYVDGLIGKVELNAARLAARKRIRDSASTPGEYAAYSVTANVIRMNWIASLVWQASRKLTRPTDGFSRQQLMFLRDIFGNPFRPVKFDSAWRSESAVALARTAYESRNFTLLPVLADALEEAGCDHPDVLAHCRQPDATHVRGCWVVDLVLGKS